MTFTPPRSEERLRAIGRLTGLPPALRRALEPGSDFDPVPTPRPSDWLATHDEAGQTFDEFVASRPVRPSERRCAIYLQPFGRFGAGPMLERLREFAEAFFALPVRMLPEVDAGAVRITRRKNPYTGQEQLLTGDILRLLERSRPADAYCLLAITPSDLYPDPGWNFVFGQASLRSRVGVYSFARYAPAFSGDAVGDPERLLLQRSCNVLAHETGHIFGVHHCVFFRCLMNGSNHLAESDARPLHFCPVDLRKLQHSIGFDVERRYRGLLEFSVAAGFAAEAAWLRGQLRRLQQAAREAGA
jgi:archaemetzincin